MHQTTTGDKLLKLLLSCASNQTKEKILKVAGLNNRSECLLVHDLSAGALGPKGEGQLFQVGWLFPAHMSEPEGNTTSPSCMTLS